MKQFFLRNKWPVIWSSHIILVLVFIIICLSFSNYEWINIVVRMGGMFFTILTAILIMIFNGERSEKAVNKQLNQIQDSTKEQIDTIQQTAATQMEHITKLTGEQIEVNRSEYDKQNKIITEGYKLQIDALKKEFEQHISHLKELTNKQIGTAQKETEKQIASFVEHTNEITDRLEDISEHLMALAKLNGQLVEAEEEIRELEKEKMRRRASELQEKKFVNDISKERFKPILGIRFENDTYLMFWNWIYVYVANQGSKASSLQITVTFRNQQNNRIKSSSHMFSNIRRGDTVGFRAIRTRHVMGCNMVEIRINVWDTNNHEYFAIEEIYRLENSWLEINLDEKKYISSS